MHIDEERLQRLLDRELIAVEEMAARTHLKDCAPCRTELERLISEDERIASTLRHLDHPAAPVSLPAVVARAGRPGRRWPRWAAATILAVALAGGAYAVPGSPVRRWVDRVLIPAPSPAPIPRAQAQPATMGGIAVAPGARLEIVFVAPDSGSRVIVRLTTAGEAAVRGPNGGATYTADVGRVIVDARNGAADFDVDIPAAARWVKIRAGTRVILVKEGGQLRALEAGGGSLAGNGPFVLRLGGQ